MVLTSIGSQNAVAFKTARLVTAASTPIAGVVKLTLCLSPNVAGGIAFNPFKAGDYAVVSGVNANWADSFQSADHATYFFYVKGVSGNTITVSRPNTPSGKSLSSVNLSAIVERWRKNLDGGYSAYLNEPRLLENMFEWDTNLGSTSTMCAIQNRTKKILTQFWSNPEVQRNYNRLYQKYSGTTAWNTYGPQGGLNVTKFVNASMCIIYGSSRWNKGCVDGITQNCNDYTNFTFSTLDNKPLGLWQIVPSAVSDTAQWKDVPSDLTTDGLLASWLNAEWSNRSAIWTMWTRITKTYIGLDPAADVANPFRWMPAAQWNPLTAKFTNTATQACWGSGCSKCPPYGSTTCL